MDQQRIPVYLARDQRDADILNMRLAKEGIFGQTETVAAEGRCGCQVSVPAADVSRAAEIAKQFEAERHGEHGPEPSDEHPLNMVSIYSARSVQQAYMLKNALEQEGIRAVVTNEVLHGGSGVDLLGTPTAAEVLVAEEDAQDARRLALRLEDTTMADGTSDASPDDDEAGSEMRMPRPQCPQCNSPRTTRCPICHTSGTDFSAADPEYSVWAGEGSPDEAAANAGGGCGGCSSGSCSAPATPEAVSEPPLFEPRLVCSTCDEPFVPEYPRVCEWCGHEFADGYEAKQVVPTEEIPARAIAVIIGLAVLGMVAFAYFLSLV